MTRAGTVVPVPATAAAAGPTHMIQTPAGALFLQAADADSLAQLTLAAGTGRQATFTPVSLDSARRVLVVTSVRIA